MNERPFVVQSGGLKLEALLHEGTGGLLAVALHPHPQYGGDMRNHVVAAICGTLADLGVTTLRVNFRGAGRSEGAYDSGRGEADDARAAVASMRAWRPDAKLVLAGYSFGAMVAARATRDARPDALILVSLPAGAAEPSQLDDETKTLFITGGRDRLAPAGNLHRFEAPNRTIVTVPNADHGWWTGVDDLAAAVRAFIAVLAAA